MKTPLTKEEKSRIPFVKNLIKKSGGYITAKEICRIVNKHRPMVTPLSDVRLRKMLHHARLNDASRKSAIIASSNGYKYSSNKDEIKEYISSLTERAYQIVTLANAVSKAL